MRPDAAEPNAGVQKQAGLEEPKVKQQLREHQPIPPASRFSDKKGPRLQSKGKEADVLRRVGQPTELANNYQKSSKSQFVLAEFEHHLLRE